MRSLEANCVPETHLACCWCLGNQETAVFFPPFYSPVFGETQRPITARKISNQAVHHLLISYCTQSFALPSIPPLPDAHSRQPTRNSPTEPRAHPAVLSPVQRSQTVLGPGSYAAEASSKGPRNSLYSSLHSLHSMVWSLFSPERWRRRRGRIKVSLSFFHHPPPPPTHHPHLPFFFFFLVTRIFWIYVMFMMTKKKVHSSYHSHVYQEFGDVSLNDQCAHVHFIYNIFTTNIVDETCNLKERHLHISLMFSIPCILVECPQCMSSTRSVSVT